MSITQEVIKSAIKQKQDNIDYTISEMDKIHELLHGKEKYLTSLRHDVQLLRNDLNKV
jgi:hypothetical protein